MCVYVYACVCMYVCMYVCLEHFASGQLEDVTEEAAIFLSDKVCLCVCMYICMYVCMA